MKFSLKHTIYILLIPLFLVTIFTSVHAQNQRSLDGVDIGITPSTPSPGQKTSVSIESFITDLNAGSIVWVVDGKTYAKGTGLLSIDITAPPLGKKVTVLANIMTAEGKEVKKSLTIKSGGVDIIWESDGYTPPFYRGKGIYGYENGLRITAIPHLASENGNELDPKSLIYKWKKNDKVIQDQSGFGKQTLIVKEDIPRPIDIEVEVGTRTGSEKAMSSISLQPTDPSITFYEEHPLYGVLYNISLTDKVNLKNQEVSLRAVPYTFNIAGLVYAWSINNIEKPDLSKNQSITLRTKGDVEGNSSISLNIRSTRSDLQGAQNSVGIFFSKKTEDTNLKF